MEPPGQRSLNLLPQNFGELPPEFSSFEGSRVVILPLPYDATTSWQPGTRHGPKAIIEASTHLELYDEELQSEPYRVGIHTLNPLEPSTSGPEETIQRVEQAVSWLLEREKFPIMLGGEHSITLGAVRAMLKKHKALSALQLDAHADLRESFGDSPFNHACVARRIHELGVSLVQIGIRGLSTEEANYLKDAAGVITVFAIDIHRRVDFIEEALAKLKSPVYITIDLDVFDPSVCPSVGTPEPGGLDWYTVLSILRKASKAHEVVGFDVVELCPMAGLTHADFLAAKLVYKSIGYLSHQIERR